jgi:hypothetical protein
MHPALNLFA